MAPGTPWSNVLKILELISTSLQLQVALLDEHVVLKLFIVSFSLFHMSYYLRGIAHL